MPLIISNHTDNSLAVRSLSEARREYAFYDAVISIQDTDCQDGLTVPSGKTKQHRFVFDDTDRTDGPGVAPTELQVRQMMFLARKYRSGKLLVHCHQGQCRSAAVALGILADRLGKGNEKQAVQALISIRPSSVCNLLVLEHADRLLDRNGDLYGAWMDYENGNDKVAGIRLLRGFAI